MYTTGLVVVYTRSFHSTAFSAADLGMFSMFGRTGAPQKGAPTKGAANFSMPEKWATPEWNKSDEQKKTKKVANFWGQLTDSWHADRDD